MDEISQIKSVFGELQYRRLSQVQERLMQAGLEELRRIGGCSWGVYRKWWRLTEANMHPSVTLVLANGGGSKPGIRCVMVLDEPQNRFLLPFGNMEDFFAFASMMGIHSTYGYATLVNYLAPFVSDSGFEIKKPPVPLHNDEDTRQFGFEFLEDYVPYTQGKNSFWQGYYSQFGNKPFVLTLDTDQKPPFMKVTYIDARPPCSRKGSSKSRV